MEIKVGRSALLLLFFVFCLLLQKQILAEKKPFIVYLGAHSQTLEGASLIAIYEQRKNSHYELLGTILGSKEKAQDAIFYSYTKCINGFAALLEEEDASAIAKLPIVLSVIPNTVYKLHTTRSWGFMGQEDNGAVHGGSLWEKARFGEDVIIANLDSGVWPESESFNDEGMGPIPSRWKGSCEKGFPCNRKLIGAQHFNKGYKADGNIVDPSDESPRDSEGHGTHTLSTAAGRFVPNATVLGLHNATIKGGAPNARVATYRVCWGTGICYDADTLAGFDAAIHDGVDVISVSLGAPPVDYIQDVMSIGAFHAIQKGITVVFSAGNDGVPESVANSAPWMLTVGASSVDRDFRNYFSVGNKRPHIKGVNLSKRVMKGFRPLIKAVDAKVANVSDMEAENCLTGSLDAEKVKGKIVVCLRNGETGRVDAGKAVRDAGGSGMVLANGAAYRDSVVADAYVIPATHLTYTDGISIYDYINTTKTPYGFITAPREEIKAKRAPVMAVFSSQGPNSITPDILKPDITAPGVDILAAFTMAVTTNDGSKSAFNIMSGTSMACPHISGIVGLLKTLHPLWSPAAIKSAIMTTAITQDNRGEPIAVETKNSTASNTYDSEATPFSYGSGHVRPNRAMDPGLVYDLTESDYLDFLCSLGYNSTQISLFKGQSYTCPSNPLNLKDFNYPSIAVPNLSGSITVARTLKNVGIPGTYTAHVRAPPGISVSVSPESLEFGKVGEEKKFEVTFRDNKTGGWNGDYVFGALVWFDGKHYVRSPIAVKVGK